MMTQHDAAESSEEARELVIRGVVVPVAWNAVGAPIGVAVLTADEGEYRIAPRGMGRRLFSCLTEEVVARIVPRRDAAGNPISDVVSFTLVADRDDHGVCHRGEARCPAARRR